MYDKVDMVENIQEILDTMDINRVKYIDDSSTSATINLGDNYTARCTSYLYFNEDTTLTMKLTTNDAGTFFINDEIQTNSAGKKITTAGSASTFNNCLFNKG